MKERYPGIKHILRSCRLCDFQTYIYEDYEQHMNKHDIHFDHSKHNHDNTKRQS